MLSLSELRRAAAVLDSRFSGHRVERWVQPDPHQLAFSLYGRDGEAGEFGEDREAHKRVLIFSCHPKLARVCLADAMPRAPQRPPAFSSYLRAHLSGARLRGASILDDDRQLDLRLESREGEFHLLLSIFGARSNLYLLGSGGEILQTLRPLQECRSELELGAAYQSPGASKPRPGEDRFAEHDGIAYLAAIGRHYVEEEADLGRDQLGRDLAQALRKEIKSARKRLDKLEVELKEADRAGEYARNGELLKSALGRIRQGDSEVKVDDYETGEEIVIPLDPQKSPKANLDATFKRYQKLLRRLTKAGGQLDPAQEWLQEVECLHARVTELLEDSGEGTLEEIQAISDRPEVRKLIRRRAGPAQQSRPADEESRLPSSLRGIPTRLLPRRYRSLDGMEIWVGRSDEGNDYLTTRLARGKDLFFHVDGAPGSHVILRTEGRSDPPSDSLLDACELAVRYSKQRNASTSNVHVVPIKNVKKPKGAKKGLVYVTGGKSIHLRREEARLERLMQSKIE